MLSRLQILLSAIVLLCSVQALPINITTRATVFCGPSTWITLVAFYLLNYGVHAMTIKSAPGDRAYRSFWWILAALFLPYSGIIEVAVQLQIAKDTVKPIYRTRPERAHCARLPGQSLGDLEPAKVYRVVARPV
jgi:hypothetical protein